MKKKMSYEPEVGDKVCCNDGVILVIDEIYESDDDEGVRMMAHFCNGKFEDAAFVDNMEWVADKNYWKEI